MNSDVLAVDRIWARVPGARRITRAAATLDGLTLRLSGLRGAVAVVVGSAMRVA